MKRLAACAACAAVLIGCSSNVDADSRAVQQHSRQTIPSADARVLRVENVVGSIMVTGANGPNAVIDTTKFAGHQDSIDNTQIDVERNGGEITLHTHYLKTGWFSSRGAGVDYVLTVPPHASVHLANVSGPVTVRNMSGDVEVQEVSGPVQAVLGRVDGNREIRVNSVSGGVTLAVARNSDVTVNARTVSGPIQTFFSTSGKRGFVGQEVHGRIGNGSATIDVNSVSGNVSIDPQ